ncbi:hypothetical protein [Nocardioides luteus]|uniref:hypothetical protein n=1 Tax=Nocardioides luteus TaxID=1844 RepID=UPI0018C9D4BD|nr:hypothetical protein [Nocardioides luteus]MBG6098055.1 hypothetical protein [Nocardioides luteus]
MTFETLLVMAVGIAALTGLRIVLALIGKGHAADHSTIPRPREEGAVGTRRRAVRGTGRNRNLLYFVPSQEPQPMLEARQATASGERR